MKAIDHDHKGHARGIPVDRVVLAHDARSLRRKLLRLASGDELLVDLPTTVHFETGDVLVREDGKLVEIVAGEEALYAVRGRDTAHALELVWHIGNRHLPCQIQSEGDGFTLLIGRDHVIRDMLEGLGARVEEITAPFSPIRGAYVGHSHAYAHDHGHGHAHTHAHNGESQADRWEP